MERARARPPGNDASGNRAEEAGPPSTGARQSRTARVLGLESGSLGAALRNAWRHDGVRFVRFAPARVKAMFGRPLVYMGKYRMYINPRDRVISYAIALHGAFSRSEVEALLRIARPGDAVLDVGANIGCHVIPLGAAVGAGGRVYAVEPEPGNVELLRRNVAANGLSNVEVLPVAAGDQAGTVTLTLSRANGGLHSIASGNVRDAQASIEVPCVRLDDVLRPEPRRLSLVKMDVQGAEWLVVAGAVDLLSRHRPVVLTEFAPGFLRGTGGDPAAFLARFEMLGYAVFLLDEEGLHHRTASSLLASDVGEVNLLLVPREDRKRIEGLFATAP